jgi:hypothetical protein
MYMQGTDRSLLGQINVTAAHSSGTYLCLTECWLSKWKIPVATSQYILPHSHPHLPVVYLFSQTRKCLPSHSCITVSPGTEEMPSLNTPVHRLKVATLPLDSPWSGPVSHSGEVLTKGKSHRKKLDRFSLKTTWIWKRYHDLNMQLGLLEG